MNAINLPAVLTTAYGTLRSLGADQAVLDELHVSSDLATDLILFVEAADCFCRPAEGRFAEHTCMRCTLLARCGIEVPA